MKLFNQNKTKQKQRLYAQELQVAISAANQGHLSDTHLAGSMLKIDDELRLRHLTVRAIFGMMVQTALVRRTSREIKKQQ